MRGTTEEEERGEEESGFSHVGQKKE